jgi:hypothetical protein
MSIAVARFTWGSYLLRLLGALVLVFVTYNPHEISYYHWLRPALSDFSRLGAVMAFAGVVILILWAIYLRATFRSLGAFGTLLAVAFFATLIWVFITYVPLATDNYKVIVYLGMVALAGVLSAGVSWSHVRRRITGQLDVDDVDQ